MKPDLNIVADSAVQRQLGGLCWRKKNDRVQILLITSRETGRWVLPKGWPMADRSNEKAVAIEAWEEAGATGRVGPQIGQYQYDKIQFRATDRQVMVPCRVDVHAMRITDLSKRYPERKQRRRKWFDLAVAAQKVHEPDLAALIAGFVPAAT